MLCLKRFDQTILEVPSNLLLYDSMKFKALHENLASALQPQTCLTFRALGTRGSPSPTEANNPSSFWLAGKSFRVMRPITGLVLASHVVSTALSTGSGISAGAYAVCCPRAGPSALQLRGMPCPCSTLLITRGQSLVTLTGS